MGTSPKVSRAAAVVAAGLLLAAGTAGVWIRKRRVTR
jgi:LPXTG-motif cell wall-anchored protein